MKTILLVEDEQLLREGVQEVLELHGYLVIGAANGIEALTWLSETHVDLIITDIVMPEMDGVDFVAKLREINANVPVIVASGSCESVIARYGLNSIHIPGSNAIISKPFKSKELIKKIEEIMI